MVAGLRPEWRSCCFDDADYLALHWIPSKAEALPNGIPTGPIAPGQLLVDDDDGKGACPISVAKVSAV